jgi:hypothetical protein
MEQELTRALEIDDGGQQLRNLVSRASNFFDVIMSFFFHEKKEFKLASLEIYIRKAYSEHSLTLVRPFAVGMLFYLFFHTTSIFGTFDRSVSNNS